MDDERISSAMSDLSTIRETIERSRVDFGRLAGVFMIYGIINLLISIGYRVFARLRLIYIMNRAWSLWVMATYIIQPVLYIGIGIFFFMERRRMKQMRNLFSFKILNIWGVIMSVLPMIYFIVSVTSNYLYHMSSNAIQGFVSSDVLGCIVNVSFIAGIFVTGVLIGDDRFRLLSVGLAFIYVLVPFFATGSSSFFSYDSQAFSSVNTVNDFFANIGYLIYLIFGVKYWRHRKENTHGI